MGLIFFSGGSGLPLKQTNGKPSFGHCKNFARESTLLVPSETCEFEPGIGTG